MYLQVTTLAKLMNHTGKELLPQVLTNYKSKLPKGLPNVSTSCLQWPNVHLPSPACWSLWLNTICTIYMGSNHGIHLQQPLGE